MEMNSSTPRTVPGEENPDEANRERKGATFGLRILSRYRLRGDDVRPGLPHGHAQGSLSRCVATDTFRGQTVPFTWCHGAAIVERFEARKGQRMNKDPKLRSIESDGLYRRIIESPPEGIWIVDENLRTTFANLAMATMLDTTIEGLVGSSPFDWMPDEERMIAEASSMMAEAGRTR
jgi:PAS domain-containing protein